MFYSTGCRSKTGNSYDNYIWKKENLGSKIMSDMWLSYRSLYNSYQYRHAEVNYNLIIVDPEYPTVQTQNVESMWCHDRKKLRSQNRTSTRLFEVIWLDLLLDISIPTKKIKY